MKVETWPITKPIPYARNARMLSPVAVAKVAVSIKEFGWQQPIVVDSEGVIIVGHTRLLAAQQLDLSTVPVVVADNLTPAQVKAYRLADNRVAQESSWDYELLNVELEELSEFDVDITITGFDTDEIADLSFDPPEINEYSEDDTDRGASESKLIECPHCHHRFEK